MAQHGLEDRVTFAGALSHPATLTLLRRADLFALASFAEGIPVALMEAMALGLPCVSTTVAGIPELIRSGVDGLLVPPANVAALAEALEALATDARLRRTLGAAARQRVIARYNLPLNQELLAQAFAARMLPIEPCRDQRGRVLSVADLRHTANGSTSRSSSFRSTPARYCASAWSRLRAKSRRTRSVPGRGAGGR